MGDVLATIKVMPVGLEVDLENLKKEVEEKLSSAKLDRIEEEEIAFGLKALKVFVTLEDSAGGTSSIEEIIRSLEGVSQVETIDVRRLL